jgi:hypothetical protein
MLILNNSIEKIFTGIGAQGVNQYITPPQNRELISGYLSGLINSFYPFKQPIEINPSIVAKLKNDGIVLLPNYISNEKIENIQNYFKTKPGWNAHVPKASNSKPYNLTDDYQFPMFSYSADDSLNCKEIFDLVIDPFFISVAFGYLNCFPTCYSVNTYKTLPKLDYATHTPHRDYDDYKFLACFVYLSDVLNLDAGPLMFYPKTHRQGEKANPVPIMGTKGTVVVCDPYALHHGSAPRLTTRFACWWRYGFGLNGAYHIDENYKYKIKIDPVDKRITNEILYLLKGFIDHEGLITSDLL